MTALPSYKPIIIGLDLAGDSLSFGETFSRMGESPLPMKRGTKLSRRMRRKAALGRAGAF